MKFARKNSPHWLGTLSVSLMMRQVIWALLPTLAISAWLLGSGVLLNTLLAITLCLLLEAIALRVLNKPVKTFLYDGSALVTALLIALALPPLTPWWVTATGALFGIVVAKHLYGGLGHNLFNPAMVGYAVVLVSFPSALAHWPTPVDGLTNATALVSLRHRDGLTIADAWQATRGFGWLGGYAWEWINAAFLAGGLALCAARLAAWRVVLSLLTTLAVLAAIGYDAGSSTSAGSPLFHLFTGATMLGAFFFATDPVSHPIAPRGQIIFGITVGAMTFAVRAYGNYPDGMAFGVLLANALTPYLDKRLTPAHAQ